MCLLEVMITMLIVLGLFTGQLFGPQVFFIIMLVGVPVALFVYWLNIRFAERFAGFAVGGRVPWTGPALETDQAEAYLAQQEYDAALYQFQEALKKARGPQRLPLLFKLAETAQLAQHWDEALHWWREILGAKRGVKAEQRAAVMFRMAELLQTQYNDRRAAARLLQRVRTEHPDSEYARYADERLRRLTTQRPDA